MDLYIKCLYIFIYMHIYTIFIYLLIYMDLYITFLYIFDVYKELMIGLSVIKKDIMFLNTF